MFSAPLLNHFSNGIWLHLSSIVMKGGIKKLIMNCFYLRIIIYTQLIDMIIPVRCFTCSKVLGDKYRYYLEEVRQKKLAKTVKGDSMNIEKVMYLTKEFHEKTAEGEVMDSLNLKKMCCRRHFLTHVDIE
jgi:DNA-directed RNA polymerase subunit N (RpoN/RPB10)